MTESAVNSITPIDWEDYNSHVKTLEHEFWEKHGLMEEVMDTFIISAGGIDSSKEGNDSENCSSDSELACPLSD